MSNKNFKINFKKREGLLPGTYLAQISKVAPIELKNQERGVRVTFYIEDATSDINKITVTYPLCLAEDSKLYQLVSNTLSVEMCDDDSFDPYTLVGERVLIYLSRREKRSNKTYISDYRRYIPDETVCGYSNTAESGIYPAELYSWTREGSSLQVTFKFQDILGNIVMLSSFLIYDGFEDVLCARFKKALDIEELSNLNILDRTTITIRVNKNRITDFEAAPPKQDSIEPGSYIAVIKSIENNGDEDGYAEYRIETAFITFQQTDGTFRTFDINIMEEEMILSLGEQICRALIPEDISFNKSYLEKKKIIVIIDDEDITDIKKYVPTEREKKFSNIRFGKPFFKKAHSPGYSQSSPWGL